MAPVTMKVEPSSATCEKWSLLRSMNCGMNAPKNTSTLGLESSTTKPCRKNPARGGGELYGDGINIAVRLEGIADPGGILISEKVYSEVEGKLDVGFEDRGEQQLKNIAKPVRAYAVRAKAHSPLSEG